MYNGLIVNDDVLIMSDISLACLTGTTLVMMWRLPHFSL